jgi:hypothetical protein
MPLRLFFSIQYSLGIYWQVLACGDVSMKPLLDLSLRQALPVDGVDLVPLLECGSFPDALPRSILISYKRKVLVLPHPWSTSQKQFELLGNCRWLKKCSLHTIRQSWLSLGLPWLRASCCRSCPARLQNADCTDSLGILTRCV